MQTLVDGLPEVVDALSKAWWGIRQAAISPDARLLDLEMTLAAICFKQEIAE
ncbi:MAG: hypothetical protein ACXVCM_24125 [Ktedonobacteraceae bacterium]